MEISNRIAIISGWFSVLVVALWILALIDIVKSGKNSKEPVTVWILLILLLPLVGSLLYFQIGRKRLRENKREFNPSFHQR